MEELTPEELEELVQELQEEAKRNTQARNSLVLGVTSLILALLNFVPGLLSALGFAGALAGLFAVLAGLRGLRAARELGKQGRNSAIAGIAAGALGLLVFIAVMASSVVRTQREVESLLTPQPPQTFQKDDLVLTYPGSWIDLSQETCEQISQPEFGLECLLAIGHPSGDGTSINLVRFSLGLELALEFADELIWDSFESSTSDVDLESRDTVEIGGQQAVRRVFSVPSSKASDGRAHILLVYLVNGPSVYQFTGWTPSADALSQHRSEIEEIVAGAHFGAIPEAATEPVAARTPPAVVSVRPAPAAPVLHPQWTSYTQANFANDLHRLEDDLWAATDGGVLRWNLSEGTCVKYTPEHGLASNFVSAIAVDGEGVLWFGTYFNGVSRFDPLAEAEAWTAYTMEDGLASDEVRAVAVDGEGALWFATVGGGVSRFDPLREGEGLTSGEVWRTYTIQDGLASDNVYAMTVDSDGVLWFGTDLGVSSYDGDEWATHTVEDGLASDEINAITLDAEGVLWFGTEGGVSRFDPLAEGEPWTTYTPWDGLASGEVNSVAVDGDGILWFGTDGGVSRFDGESWTTYTERDGLVSDGVYTIATDEDGSLWFGTEYGISHLGPAPDVEEAELWTTYTTNDELRGNSGTDITVTSDGALWFGSLGGGVSRFDGETWETYSEEDGLASKYVLSAAEGPDGALYLATGGGACRFDGEAWMTYPETADLAGGPGVIAWASDGTLWYGTAKGVSSFDGETWTTYTAGDGLAANYMLGIAETPEGVLWFATNDGISRFDGETWATYTTDDGLAHDRVAALAVAADGALWFATQEGVSRFDGETWTTYTAADGLANDDVRALTVASDGVLWFGTEGGVSRFDGQNWTTYTTADGLVNESVWAIAVAPDGALWFSTWGGVSRFVPAGVPTTTPAATAPPVAVQPTEAPAAGIRVGLVTDVGGIDDAGYNQNSWEGLQRARKELDVEIQFIESQAQADYEKNISEFAEQGYDMIVTAGIFLLEATARMAVQYPGTRMATVDVFYDPPIPNVASIVFSVDEAAFPTGYLAAGWANLQDPNDPQVGWIGGMQIPPVEQYVVAYEAGVAYYNQQKGTNVQVKGVYVGDFMDPDEGKTQGQLLIDQGVDVIFGVGGKTTDGSLAAAKESGKWGIGYDVDQYYTLPNEGDILITSCVKRMDNAVFGVVELLTKGEFPGGGVYVGTLENEGVGLAPYHDFEDQIPDELTREVEAVLEGIKKGEIDTGW